MVTEGEIKIGDVLADNDPRCPGRRLTVVGVKDGRVAARVGATPRIVKVALSRIHADGRPRRTGFSLIANGGL